MSNCPCCSHQMLRHIRSQQVHWFCRHCWQEMPQLDSARDNSPHLTPFSRYGINSVNSLSREVALRIE